MVIVLSHTLAFYQLYSLIFFGKIQPKAQRKVLSKDPNVVNSEQEEEDIAKGMKK